MSYPDKYTRQFDYSSYQHANPTRPLPADKVNADLNQVAIISSQTVEFLKGIARADGKLKNGAVGYDQLSPALQSAGLAPADAWAASKEYVVGNSVVAGASLYRCVVSHTSSVFAVDLAAGRWLFVADIATGPQGEQGPQGIQGEQGEHGIQGEVGPEGPPASFIQAGTGAVTRTIQDKARDIVSVKDFDCVGDDSADNATALDTAISAASANGFNLFLPPGIYRTSAAHTLPANVSLIGAGKYVTTLKTTSATNSLLLTSGTGVSIKSLSFASSVPRTAGSFVEINNGLFELSDFVMNGPFIGVLFQSAQRTLLVCNGEITDAVPMGESMKFVNAGTDVSVHDIVCTINSTSARPAAHMSLYVLGDLSMSDIQMYGAVNNMIITPGSGQGISSLKCVNVWFDQANEHNLLVQPTGTGFFKRSSFIGSWFSGSATASGATMFPSGASTSIDCIDFTACEFLSNATSGVFTGGTAGTISNIQINGGRVAGNASQGILFDGVLGGQIQNVRIGPVGGYGGANGTGVYLAGAADNINVSGNDLRGNTTALTNAATGTNNRIKDNIGYNPVGGLRSQLEPHRSPIRQGRPRKRFTYWPALCQLSLWRDGQSQRLGATRHRHPFILDQMDRSR